MFGHVGPMLFISSSQTMREVDPENEQRYTDTITRLFNEITTRLVKPDLKGLPSDQSTYQMKYWWPHNEALVALLLADHITGEKKYADWYEKVHEWTFSHFPDREYGEWFGYLNRDGSVNLPIKGGDWKGSFHVSRMFMYGIQLLQKN